MRKYLAILLIVMMPVLNITGADGDQSASDPSQVLDHSSATFEILGYKVDRSSDITFEIRDALSESLSVVSSLGNIELNNYIGKLLGNVNAWPSDPRNQIVFSFRVTGRGEGAYHIDFKFEPFYRYVDNGIDKNTLINASYALTNLSYSFPDYTSNSWEDGVIENREGTTSTELAIVRKDSPESTLSSYWAVTGTDAPLWMHRGAITLTIDNGSAEGGYNSPDTAFGQYKAAVTATLYGP